METAERTNETNNKESVKKKRNNRNKKKNDTSKVVENESKINFNYIYYKNLVIGDTDNNNKIIVKNSEDMIEIDTSTTITNTEERNNSSKDEIINKNYNNFKDNEEEVKIKLQEKSHSDDILNKFLKEYQENELKKANEFEKFKKEFEESKIKSEESNMKIQVLKAENIQIKEEIQVLKEKELKNESEIQVLKAENIQLKDENIQIKLDIGYLKKITNFLGIRIFIEKFILETGLNLDILSKKKSLLTIFRYIFRILGDDHSKNNDVNNNSFFKNNEILIKQTFGTLNSAINCFKVLTELNNECNNFVHISSKNDNDWETGTLETNNKYYNSLLMIKNITKFNYNINLIEESE